MMRSDSSAQNRVAKLSRRLLTDSAFLEIVVGQAMVIAHLDTDVEIYDWYIEDSVAPRVRDLLEQTRSLHAQLPPPHARGSEANLDKAARKLDAVQDIADKIFEESKQEGGTTIEREDITAMAARTLEAFILTRDTLTSLANPAPATPPFPGHAEFLPASHCRTSDYAPNHPPYSISEPHIQQSPTDQPST